MLPIIVISTIGVVGYEYMRNKKVIQQNIAVSERINIQLEKETQDRDKNAAPWVKYEGKRWWLSEIVLHIIINIKVQ